MSRLYRIEVLFSSYLCCQFQSWTLFLYGNPCLVHYASRLFNGALSLPLSKLLHVQNQCVYLYWLVTTITKLNNLCELKFPEEKSKKILLISFITIYKRCELELPALILTWLFKFISNIYYRRGSPYHMDPSFCWEDPISYYGTYHSIWRRHLHPDALDHKMIPIFVFCGICVLIPGSDIFT